MNLEDLVDAGIAGDEPAIPDELRDDFARAIAGYKALQFALGETILLPESTGPERPPPVLPDDYEIQRELGRGGMGVVYLVRQKSLDRLVAVKVLRPGELTFGPLVRRFLEEARHLARLRHPNVVSVHEIGEAGVEPFFSMDYIDGKSLSEMLARERLSPSQALAIVKQAAEGVAHAHQFGIIHRDLKPSNILVDDSGRAYVSDFGLARNTAQESDLTHSGIVLGTPQYMAPEQAQGQSHLVGEATDVHALGAILYETLTGHAAYGRDGAMNVLVRLTHEDPAPLRRYEPRIPRDLETICLKALAKQPAARYPTVRAFLEDLRRYEAGEPLMARRPRALHRAWCWFRRHGKPAAAALFTAATVLAVGLTVAPMVFDKSVEELIAWGDEEHLAGRHEDAVRAYQRAFSKSTGADRASALQRLIRCCREVNDSRQVLPIALKIIESAPEASFGKHDYLIIQALLTRLRSENEHWSWTVPSQKVRPLMTLLHKRLTDCLDHSTLDESQRREAQELRSILRSRLAGDPLTGTTLPGPRADALPTGPVEELQRIADDEEKPAWERGKAAYGAFRALQNSGDAKAALTTCRKAYRLLRSAFPTYAGVRRGVPGSTKPEDRRIADQAAECQLLQVVYASLRKLDQSDPQDLCGGLRFNFAGLAIPSDVCIWPEITLYDPAVPGAEREINPVLPRTFAVQTDQTAWVGVANGRYRLRVAGFGMTWDAPSANFAQRLEVDYGSIADDVEIRGDTVELPPVRVWLADEISLLAPAEAGAIDLARDAFRWSPAAGAASYHVFLHDESNLGGQQIIARIETAKTSLTLSDSRVKRVGSIEPYLVPGRTVRWRVEAFDAAGGRVGKSLKDGRFLVARGLNAE
ncbi:MAG: serine/threonine protein kinase [Planctomycetia bacterium]|nr:serine/threonine protein kinase [Planctomycetia bacterium]